MWRFKTYRQLLKQVILGLLLFYSVAECHKINWGFVESSPEDEPMLFSNFQISDTLDNGRAQYLIDAYTNRLLEGMFSKRSDDRLTEEQTWILKTRLKGLYAYLKNHPALMDRRFQVGSRKPEIPKRREKRLYEHSLAQPVCPSVTEWRQLRSALDMNDTEVEVLQPQGPAGQQWFYTVRCNNEHEQMLDPECPFCCRGIRRSRYSSRCITMKSYVMALIKRPGDTEFDWNWIQVDSSCNCAISDNLLR